MGTADHHHGVASALPAVPAHERADDDAGRDREGPEDLDQLALCRVIPEAEREQDQQASESYRAVAEHEQYPCSLDHVRSPLYPGGRFSSRPPVAVMTRL